MNSEEIVRKFRKALNLSVDEIVKAMTEQGLSDPESLEAEIVVKFPGTNTEIRSRPRVEPDSPEPTNVAQVA